MSVEISIIRISNLQQIMFQMVMSIFSTFRLTKTTQASITNQHILDSIQHFHSQTPWPIKTAWVKALYRRDKRICSTNVVFNKQN